MIKKLLALTLSLLILISVCSLSVSAEKDVLKFDKDGKLLKGTIIRHLVLPNQRHDSMSLLGWIDKNTSPEQVLVSVMFQYTPFDFIPDEFKELKRRLTRMECRTVSDYVDTLSFNGYTQSLSAASEKYVPDF